MGILSRAGDLVYTFRFLKLLVTPFEKTQAFKLGIIDADGKRNKELRLTTSDQKSAYTTFHRLVFNIKRLMAKAPGGSSRLATYASALFLLKEHLNLTDDSLRQIIAECNVSEGDLLSEQSSWFIVGEDQLAPGMYKVREAKVLNKTVDELVTPGDQVRVHDNALPVGDVLGVPVYEATHIRTNQQVYVTVAELYK